MHLLNLKIDRIIIHQIYQRDSEGNIVNPTQGRELVRFDDAAMGDFKKRVVGALGNDSRAVEMEIVGQEAQDLASLVDVMIDQDDETFMVSSFDIAKLLTRAQHRKDLSGGIVVVFTGKQGTSEKKFLGIIKAEVYSAYEKIIDEETGEISLKYVQEVLLTPASKLYKTAGFFEKSNYEEPVVDLNHKWTVMVSDHQLNKVDGKAAAQYFYIDFLGCGYPDTSARKTKLFYDSTVKFITALDVPSEKRSGLLNALNTYLKVEESGTISTSQFGERYFDADTLDVYKEHMKDAGVPSRAITKDIEHIATELKTRKVSFRSNVRILGPSEAFKDLVTIETIPGDIDESGAPAEWTKITVKDRIARQE